MAAGVPQLGVTYYRTVEEQQALQRKKEEEKMYLRLGFFFECDRSISVVLAIFFSSHLLGASKLYKQKFVRRESSEENIWR